MQIRRLISATLTTAILAVPVLAYNACSNMESSSARPSGQGGDDQTDDSQMRLEVPIEMTDTGLASSPTPTVFSHTRTSFNAADYDGTVSFSFEITATNADSAARRVTLVDGADVVAAAITVPANANAPVRLRGTFSPAGAANYRVALDATSTANELRVYAVRVLVRQTGATKTRIYVPLIAGAANSPLNRDDSGAAVAKGALGGLFDHADPRFVALWKKDGSAFSQLAVGTPYTLEAVLSTSMPAVTTATAALFNFTRNQQVAGTELSTTSAVPELVSADFADSAANFTDADDMELRIKNSGGGADAFVYRAGLWIRLENLAHAEVYYRYGRTETTGPDSGHRVWVWVMAMVDLSAFLSSAEVYNEVTGHASEPATPCSEKVFDIGSADSGTAGTAVSGSPLTFNSSSPSRQRTSGLNLHSGNRFMSETVANAASGVCHFSQPRLVVRF
jgi:hypothetical protein